MKLDQLTEQTRTIHTDGEGNEYVHTEAAIEAIIKFSHDPQYTKEFEKLMEHEAFQKALRTNVQAALQKTMSDLRMGGDKWTDDHEVTSLSTGRVVSG
jgi:hypothetical protein